ncbi:DUF3644 domain-containing protein [Vibrio cholerae]|uniref:DUF3644 domain-containing protein n=1 Tax=Vibrio cholerae TaxID=666 RepID=UPI0007443A43|nr:DUF3644 domain-containing protein [Vibrio cholerae]EGR4060001.1 DUF3644 domain-containing protein [Vibrio cholerae]EGR4155419.1 DUF3644 domain-containing protein [Vibrio cholerae]EJL6346997.1 DUF3644 domain-containing protein [Vibrio cholerae]EKF9445024.1 DUF3644 domain-containing protein [Vibrio cholerae]ELM0317221.1 DUF3644 domain-containing protein [Vibrio cholerae]
MKVSKSLSALHGLLRDKEASGQKFGIDDILDATGWKIATFKTYWAKGQLADFISEVSDGIFEASNCQDLSEIEFAKLLSQSKHRRGLGHNCKSKLAKALLSKSKDNMLLALELYNRPSLENRMDAFVMCFCTAWEQFLKALLIERDGESSIFRKSGKKGLKETISLRECLEKVYSEKSNVRKNIEQIAFLRDQAVHLLMPEIQGIMSRVFQSGVLNYTSKFEEFTEISFLNTSHAGMISLVGEFKSPPASIMKSTYGDIASEIIELASSVQQDVERSDDIEFAIPLNVKLVFATDAEDGSTIAIARADEGIEGLKRALVIEKPVDRSKSHPLLQKDAINEINARLHERYDIEKLKNHLVCICQKTSKPVVNRNCFDAVLAKNKWKQGDNRYHYKNKNPEIHYYSNELVEEFIKKIMEQDGYLSSAKHWHNRKNKN